MKQMMRTRNVNELRMFQGGIVLVVVAYVFHGLIMRLPEGDRSSMWTGIITIYNFFRSLIYPGFAILFLYMLRHKNPGSVFLVILAGLLPLHQIIFLGRREVTATFCLTIGLALFFNRRWAPPQWTVLAILLFTVFALPFTGVYRRIAQDHDWGELLQIDAKQFFKEYLEEGGNLELKNAAYIIQYAKRTENYQYGFGYWDNLVFNFIPAHIIGEKFKSLLMTKPREFMKEKLSGYYSYTPPTGSTYTGIADAFLQFGYWGCLFFFLMGYYFKHLWFASVQGGSLYTQIFYIQMVSPAMLAITHGTINFPAEFFYNLIFLNLLMLYAKKRNVAYLSLSR